MNFMATFRLTTAITFGHEYMYTSYINTQIKQQRSENTLKYVSGARDQEGIKKFKELHISGFNDYIIL